MNTCIEADLGQDGFFAFVYLCESCVTEWGRSLGQLDAAQVEKLKATLAERDAEVASLRQRLEAFSQLNELIKTHSPTLAEPVVDKPKKVVK